MRDNNSLNSLFSIWLKGILPEMKNFRTWSLTDACVISCLLCDFEKKGVREMESDCSVFLYTRHSFKWRLRIVVELWPDKAECTTSLWQNLQIARGSPVVRWTSSRKCGHEVDTTARRWNLHLKTWYCDYSQYETSNYKSLRTSLLLLQYDCR